ncbi:MAG: lysophospholipid acyltransferase family protein [bacterium]
MTHVLGGIAILAHVFKIDQGRHRVQQWCMRTWAKSLVWAGGVKVVVHGDEHIDAVRGTVYASNHLSWFDIFAVASVLPRYTFVAKAELRKIWMFGWGAEGAGVVFMARENRKSAFDTYAAVAQKVKAGLSVIVYPEGTRGNDYRLRPFKKGPFVLAIQAGAPVVPIVVYGTREVMSKTAWRVRPGVVHVHLLAPVATTGYDYDHRHDLMHEVWRRMAEVLRTEHGVESGDSNAVETQRLERSA